MWTKISPYLMYVNIGAGTLFLAFFMISIYMNLPFQVDSFDALIALLVFFDGLIFYMAKQQATRVTDAVTHYSKNKLQVIYMALNLLSKNDALNSTEIDLVELASRSCEELSTALMRVLKTGAKDFNKDVNILDRIGNNDMPVVVEQ